MQAGAFPTASMPHMPIGSDIRPVAVITGASSGIGRATAIEAVRRGYRVVAAARRADELERTLELCAGEDPGRAVTCDVADEAQVAALAADVSALEGRCDVLVVNAGVGARTVLDGPDALEPSLRVLDVNLRGAVTCIGHLLPLLRDAREGAQDGSRRPAIVGVSSVAGLVEVPNAPAYAASKAGLTQLLGSMRPALARDGIRAGCVHPGPVPTPGWPHERLVASRLGRRLVATPEETAAAILDVGEGRRRAHVVVPRVWHLVTGLRRLLPPAWRGALRVAGSRLPADRTAREREGTQR